MKKSMLVIDTPNSCKECPFCRGLNACKVMKYLNGDKITTIYTVDKQVMEGGKPDWCPLQDETEKKGENPYHNERESGYVDGWNECIDKIVGSND